MNEYKIEVKEVLKKELIVEAENIEKALEILKNNYIKGNKKEFKNKDLLEVEAKIIEENGQEIYDNYDEEIEEKCMLFGNLNDKFLEIECKLDDIAETQEYIGERIDFIADFVGKTLELIDVLDESLEINVEVLDKKNN